MFKIQTIKNRQKDDIKIIDDEFNIIDNYYSIITGENGCGKSSLLSKAVNHYIFSTKLNSSECKVVEGLFLKPSKVVAICNAKYNRFASRKTYIDKSEYFDPGYYIQTSENNQDENPLISLIKSAMQEFFRPEKTGVDFSIPQPDKIEKAFEMIGLSPEVHFSFELDFNLINKLKEVFSPDSLGWEEGLKKYPTELKEYEFYLDRGLVTAQQVAEFYIYMNGTM